MNDATIPDADRLGLIQELNRNYDLELGERLSASDLEEFLAARLNRLIQSDFNAVVSILYRVDVNEVKLKEMLKGAMGEDAGRVMARLIIERQEQKRRARKASGEDASWKD
jgi:hypothetical protein